MPKVKGWPATNQQATPPRLLSVGVGDLQGFIHHRHPLIDLLFGDDQRRRDANDVLVRLLGQEAVALERLAEPARAAGRRRSVREDYSY